MTITKQVGAINYTCTLVGALRFSGRKAVGEQIVQIIQCAQPQILKVWCAASQWRLDGDYYPIDFRIYAKEADGKTKNDHFQELLLRAVGAKDCAF